MSLPDKYLPLPTYPLDMISTRGAGMDIHYCGSVDSSSICMLLYLSYASLVYLLDISRMRRLWQQDTNQKTDADKGLCPHWCYCLLYPPTHPLDMKDFLTYGHGSSNTSTRYEGLCHAWPWTTTSHPHLNPSSTFLVLRQ
jgi:hypothetical protein